MSSENKSLNLDTNIAPNSNQDLKTGIVDTEEGNAEFPFQNTEELCKKKDSNLGLLEDYPETESFNQAKTDERTTQSTNDMRFPRNSNNKEDYKRLSENTPIEEDEAENISDNKMKIDKPSKIFVDNNSSLTGQTTDYASFDSNEIVELSRKKRHFLFWTLIITSILINLDHGAIPASTQEIQDDLEIDTTAIGLFGSLVYIGTAAGALFLSVMGNKLNRRLLVGAGFLMSGICLYTFTVWNNLPFLCVNRCLVGFFQSMVSVYTPIWIDQFSPGTYNTVFMSIFQISSPVGLILGYIVAYLVKDKYSWKVAFIIQAIGVGFFSISYLFFDDKLFSNNLNKYKDHDPDYEEIVKANQETGVNNSNSHNNTSDNSKGESKKEEEILSKEETSKVKEENIVIERKPSEISRFQPSFNPEKSHYLHDFVKLVKQPVYIFACLSITCLFFISTAMTFWTTDYLTNVMEFEDGAVTTSFIIISLSGPVSGLILGGIIVHKLFGGYEKTKSILFVNFCLFMASLFVVPIYFLNSLLLISGCLWFLLFFGAATIPTLQGITICSLPPKLRSSGNSVCNLLIFTGGFSAAPFFYGALFDAFKDTDKRLAFLITLSFGFIGLILSIICAIFRFKKLNKKKHAYSMAEGSLYLRDSKRQTLLESSKENSNNLKEESS